MKRGMTAGVVAFAMALLATACESNRGPGGSEGIATTGDAAGAAKNAGGISKLEYLVQAQAICSDTQRDIAEASARDYPKAQPHGELSEGETIDFVKKDVVPALRAEIAKLRALPPPKGSEGQVVEIYDALERALPQLEADPKKYTAEGENVFAEADALGKKYGLGVCATQRV